MTRDPQKHESPGSATNTTEAKSKNSAETISHLAREIAAILAVGAMVGVMFWQSVFGMTGQFGPGPEVGYTLAGVGADER